MKEELLFVYNANSDLFATVTDFAHKILSPSTYQCQLCTLTYDNFSIKKEWKSFIEDLPTKTVFLHKDDFEQQYKTQVPLPAVFILSNGTINKLITPPQIQSCHSLEELKNLVTLQLKAYVQHHHSNL